MPIRPENKARYPADWPQIRERILARAEHRCERCRKRNHETVSVLPGGYWFDWEDLTWVNNCGEPMGGHYSGPGQERQTRVVLTIAHWPDPAPENCGEDNLWALCNWCHLNIDRDIHVANAKETRWKKRAQYQPVISALLEVA